MSSAPKVRFFNTTGPCNPEDHYTLPPAERLRGAQLGRYVRDKLYWVLHAPRQTGKTTFLQSWMEEINASGEAIACYVSLERCQVFQDTERAVPEMCAAIQEFARWQEVPVPSLPQVPSGSLLGAVLADWASKVSPLPLVVLFDEADVLQGDALVSFLRQLRSGFAARAPGKFPVSIALVGMRDLRDYITAAKDGAPVNPGSPFNVKVDSAVIGNFSREDVANLFAQRTAENGQQIEPAALAYVYEQSRGQPWIVNNLFQRATMRILDRDSTETVTLAHVQEARKQMVNARETHLDSLSRRLTDPRVRSVIEPLVTNEVSTLSRISEDVEYTMDLGLVAWDGESGFRIANPVYEEIILRHLNSPYHDGMPPPKAFRWQHPDGSLDMNSLLREFQDFWREHSDIWEQTAQYTEAFPHLLLMAFLQRITNGASRITREYAIGRGRLDLCVEYDKQRYIIEIKMLRDNQTLERVRKQGLLQIHDYRSAAAPAAPAYLFIFDRRSPEKRLPWSERIYWQTDGDIQILGC